LVSIFASSFSDSNALSVAAIGCLVITGGNNTSYYE
jgi:hypothetical protein